MKTIEQAILDKIFYIGNEIPEGVANDSRAKFVVLGSPQELINETISKSMRELVKQIAEYTYYKANPDTKMDVPSIIYEQVEKDFKKFKSLMDIKGKIILDLCGGTGSWSLPYKNAGYEVRVITLPEFDVLKWRQYPEIMNVIGNVYGILAAPPCTMFSFARTKAKKYRDLEEGMQCVRACLDMIWTSMEIQQETKKKTVPLKFWALENPNGMLKFFLGKQAFEFNPYDFGDQYQKLTHLWGWFNEPKKNPIELTKRQKLQKKFDMLASREIAPEMFGKLTRQERRAITPAGFAKAFFEANQ